MNKKLAIAIFIWPLLLIGAYALFSNGYFQNDYSKTENVLGTKVDLDGDSKIDAQYLDTHASNHDVGGDDSVFPADPDFTAYLQWDDAAGETSWVSVPGGGGTVDTEGTLNADEVAMMHDADTIKSLTEAEFKAAFNLEAGTDFYSVSAADTAFEAELDDSAGLLAALSDPTGTGLAVFNITPIIAGMTMTDDIALNANDLRSTSDISTVLGDDAGTYNFYVKNLSESIIATIASSGNVYFTGALEMNGNAIMSSSEAVVDLYATTPLVNFFDTSGEGADDESGRIRSPMVTTTDGSETSEMTFNVMDAGSLAPYFQLSGELQKIRLLMDTIIYDDDSIAWGDGDDWTATYDETTDDALEFESNSGSNTSFTIKNAGAGNAVLWADIVTGMTRIVSDADGYNFDSVEDCSGTLLLMTGAGEVGLPDCASTSIGAVVCVHVRDSSEQVEVVMYGDTTNDYFVLYDGTALDANDEANMPTDGNEEACFVCMEANAWYVRGEISHAGNHVTDGGVAD